MASRLGGVPGTREAEATYAVCSDAVLQGQHSVHAPAQVLLRCQLLLSLALSDPAGKVTGSWKAPGPASCSHKAKSSFGLCVCMCVCVHMCAHACVCALCVHM